MKDRFFNGFIELESKDKNGKLELYPNRILVDGTPISGDFAKEFKKINILETLSGLSNDPKVKTKLKYIRISAIENDSIHLKAKKGETEESK